LGQLQKTQVLKLFRITFRSQVYVLKALTYEKLEELIDIALARYNKDEGENFVIKDKQAFIQYSGGDGRKLINSVELF
jgi:putative ATPase